MRQADEHESATRLGGLLVVLAAVAVALLAWRYLGVVNVTQPVALAASERPIAPPIEPPIARPARVVWVVVDGLRLDVSRTMPWLNELRVRGFDGIGEAPLPSLSRPSYSAMATGAPPVRTGVRNNAFPGAVPLDSVFDRAKQAGLRTNGIANLSWWNELFGRSFDDWQSVGGLSRHLEPDLERAVRRPSELTLMHLVDLDRIAHKLGARAEYCRAALDLDGALRRGLQSLDLDRTAVIVTSDHGHRARGGHGGPEPEVVEVPLVLAGKGFRRGGGRLGALERIGPTISLLLGLEAPRDFVAAPLFEVLDRSVLGAQYLRAREAELASYRSDYERRLRSRQSEVSLADVGGSAIPRRILAALLVAIGCISALYRARGFVPRAFLALPLIGAGALGGFVLSDLPISFSAIVSVPLVLGVLAAGTVAGVAVYLFALHRLLRTSTRDRRRAAFGFHCRCAAFAYLGVAPVLWLAFGYSQREELAPPSFMFLPLPAAFVGSVCAILLVAASVMSTSRLYSGATLDSRRRRAH